MKFRFHFGVRRCLLALLASTLCAGMPALAAEPAAEHAVRAALVFNFIRFTEWPGNAFPEGKLVLCLASSDPEQRQALQTLAARRVRDVQIVVEPYRDGLHCDLLYVDARSRWNGLPTQTRGNHALTIGGYAGFLDDGGMIEIELLPKGPRFDINLREVRRIGLRIHPQLLRLARRIED